jgi:DNA-binding NtrC family response regulator
MNETFDQFLAIAETNGVIAKSSAILEMLHQTHRIIRDLPDNTSILITGEPGSGKTLLAKVIYKATPTRCDGQFVDRQGYSDAKTAEILLFGRTISVSADEPSFQSGILEKALGGTILIEDLPEIPKESQLVILGVVNSKRVTDNAGKDFSVDVRFISTAESEGLIQDKITADLFIDKLYRYFCRCKIHIPPLRERKEDIIPLALYLLKTEYTEIWDTLQDKNNPFNAKAITYFQNEKLQWEKNVDSIRDIIDEFLIDNKGNKKQLGFTTEKGTPSMTGKEEDKRNLLGFTPEIQKAKLLEVCNRKPQPNKISVAGYFRISRGTLYNKLKEFDIDWDNPSG